MAGILANSLSKTMTTGLGAIGAVSGFVRGEQVTLTVEGGGSFSYALTRPEGSTVSLVNENTFTPDVAGAYTVVASNGYVLVVTASLPLQSEAVNGLRMTEMPDSLVPLPPATAAYFFLREDGRLAVKTAMGTFLVSWEPTFGSDGMITINAVSMPGLATTTYGGAVTLACTDPEAAAITWSVESASDSVVSLPTITPSGTPLGVTAALTFPADPLHGRGVGLMVKAQVTRANGMQITYKGIVGVPGSNGQIPITYGETDERGAQGYANELNAAIANHIVSGKSLQTTDATVTTALTLSPAAGGIDGFGIRVLGETTAGESLVAEWVGFYSRVGTAAPTLIKGAATDAGIGKTTGASTWNAAAVISGNNVLVQVTGQAATSIRWRVETWRQAWLRASL